MMLRDEFLLPMDKNYLLILGEPGFDSLHSNNFHYFILIFFLNAMHTYYCLYCSVYLTETNFRMP